VKLTVEVSVLRRDDVTVSAASNLERRVHFRVQKAVVRPLPEARPGALFPHGALRDFGASFDVVRVTWKRRRLESTEYVVRSDHSNVGQGQQGHS